VREDRFRDLVDADADAAGGVNDFSNGDGERECFAIAGSESGLEFDSGSCCALVGSLREETEGERELCECVGDDEGPGERWRLDSSFRTRSSSGDRSKLKSGRRSSSAPSVASVGLVSIWTSPSATPESALGSLSLSMSSFADSGACRLARSEF
jgi:hypothetical protein